MPSELLQGEKLIEYLDGIERPGMAVTRQWHGLWQQAVMYMWGEQLSGVKKKQDWDYIVFNYIYPLVMQGIAKESKNNPKILGRAWKDEDADYAEKWQGIIQYIWEQILNMRLDEIYALLDAAVYGYAVGKVVWNPIKYWNEKTLRWEGELEHLIVHPAYFWVEATSETLKNKPTCGTIRPVSLEWAIRQWPEFKDDLEKEAKSVSTEDEQYRYAEVGHASKIFSSLLYPSQKAGALRKIGSWLVSLIFGQKQEQTTDQKGENKKEVWLKETYFQDDATQHIKNEDKISSEELVANGVVTVDEFSGEVKSAKDGSPFNNEVWPKRIVSEYDKPLFPKGRCILRVGKTILNPKLEDQAYKFSRWPFNVVIHHALPHMWQGSNASEMLRGSQDMLNITMAQLIHFVKVASDPIKVREAGVIAKGKDGTQRKITGAAGEEIIVKPGKLNGIKVLEHGHLGSEIFALVDILRRDMEANAFLHETAQGAVDPKQMTRAESLTINQNANDMVAMRSILVEKWIEGTAIIIAEMAQEFYSLERRLRIIGIGGNTENAVMDEQLKKVEWNLEIEPGSTLPFDEERRKNDYAVAYKILGDPVVNPLLEDMLRILNIANRDKVLMKHAQTLVFRQFVALAQQVTQGMSQMQGQQIEPQQAAMMQQAVMQKVMTLFQQVAQTNPGQTAQGQPNPQKGAA